jgi:hypothetical protein
MFKKASESSLDPLLAKPDARPFLAAQSEHIQNKFDVDGHPVVSTLSEAIEKNKTSVDHFIYATNQDHRYGDEGPFRTALTAVRKGFFDARFENEFYDPLKGDPIIGQYFDLGILNHSQQEDLYRLVDGYYKYLTEMSEPKTEKKVGRHVLIAAEEHGRRALQTEVMPVVDVIQEKES